MTAAVIFVLVLAIVGWNIFVQFSVTSQVDVVSGLSPAQVHAAFRECFIGRLHDITTNGDTIQVRPRFKPKAPTLSVSARSGPNGTEVSVWLSHWVGHGYGIKDHAQWAWRKRQRFLGQMRKRATAPSPPAPLPE